MQALYFDEVRYVPAARQILQQGVNENWSHPDFGKMLIASGIAIFGDNAVGWRIMSVFFGVLTVLALYSLGKTLFGSRDAGFFCALAGLLNQMIFIHARIATLDIFSTALFMLALAIFAQIWRESDVLEKRGRAFGLILAGAMFGLAIAAKWIAVVPLLACVFLYVKRGRRTETAVYFLGSAVAAYFFTLLPLLRMRHPEYAPLLEQAGAVATTTPAPTSYGLLQILELQFQMLWRHVTLVNPHPYYSAWYSWPLQLRTVWFHREFWQDHHSGITLIGNPAILWGGLVAALYCLWRCFRNPSPTARFLVALYLPLFAIWGLMPRKASLFYYYTPAALFLGPMLVFFFRELQVRRRYQLSFLALTVSCFVFFYPVLTNLPLTQDGMKSRMWLKGWE